MQRDQSLYDGPLRESAIRVAGRSIRLIQPAEPDRLLDQPEVIAWNQSEDYMPYWAYLWPGSLLLGEALASAGWPRGTRTLELGCGLGLAGLVAVSLGLNVHFTDHDRAPLGLIEASARANGFDPSRYSTAVLDWRFPPPERYPLIIGADLTYEKRLVPLVAGVIAAVLEPGGVALITAPNRVTASGFEEALKSSGLATELIAAETTSAELGLIRGTIYRISKAPS